MAMRDAFPHGEVHLQIEPTEFRYRDYQAFLKSIAPDAAVAKARQQEAFAAERARWAAAGDTGSHPSPPFGREEEGGLGVYLVPDGYEAVTSALTASVWKILVEPGQTVSAGDSLLVLEAMKTEIVVTAPRDGTVHEIHARTESLVMPGQNLVILR
jgi:urea carboxylase